MSYLYLMAILLLMFLPPTQNNQTLPAEFYRIPEPVRDRATVIVSGRYGQGRTPCLFMADGSRRWFLDSWFDIKKVYRGAVGSKLIRINPAMLLKSGYVKERLEREGKYLVLLRPSGEKMKWIRSREGISFWEALKDDEVVAIVEIR